MDNWFNYDQLVIHSQKLGHMHNRLMTRKPDTAGGAGEPLGRRARKALAVRQALFESGLAAFERQPIGLVSILDITEAADVAKGVFYLQFKSKDDFLLALWEEVQGRFLDAVRTATMQSGSRSERVDAAIREFVSLVGRAPGAARYWIRMSSFFPDDIGQPGHFARIRQEYVQQLAALIAGESVAEPGTETLQIALVVDALFWAVVAAEVQRGQPILDTETLIKAVHAALPSLAREPTRDRIRSLPEKD